MLKLTGITSLILSVAALLGCATTDAHQTAGVLSTYVVLGENGTAIARAVTTDAQCPMIRIDGMKVQMNLRAAPAIEPLRPTRSAPADSKPSVFPVRTCEKSIPADTVQATIGELSLPLPKKQIDRIVVIGDTGCRLKKSDNAYQACNDPDRYPFAKVAAAAAKWKPDLVVHVGDYEYRENKCPDNDPGCAGSPWGYGWDTWQADFFKPGSALLQAAPWVLVRGNHESCSRAGQGWWRMLDSWPYLAGRDCNDAANDKVGDYSEPYAIPLGGGAQLIVFDSSNTKNSAFAPDDIRRTIYRDDYRKIEQLSRHADFNIMANHHPILGVFADNDAHGKVVLKPGNQGIQSVFGRINPLIIPPRIDVLLSGHLHVWQEVSFSSPHPTQFVAGFSGTMEDLVPLPEYLPPGTSPAPGAVIEHHSSWVNGFGYMTMERKGPKQWKVRVWNGSGRQVNACDIDGRHSGCELAQVK
ncbi:MAG: metallophosphoesterase [Gallionella sp.]